MSMYKHNFKVKEMLNVQKKRGDYINEEGVYCYIYNIINTNVQLGNNDVYIIDFDEIPLDSIAIGKFVWYLNQSFDTCTLGNIIFTNISVLQYRQLYVSSMSYNQKVYQDMQKKAQDVEQFLAEHPQVKEQFDSLMKRWEKI